MGLWDFAASVVSTGASFLSNKSATNAQSSGNSKASKTLDAQYRQNREDYAPWRDIGRNALYATSALSGVSIPGMSAPQNQEIYNAAVGNFKASPGYQFRLAEGINALDKSAAARGRLRSGAHEKALVRFGDGMASAEYGNYVNRLNALAGIGQQATANTAALGAQNATAQANLAVNNGNARASGYTNNARIINQGLQNALLAYNG
ncbi:hypothetical protein [Sneathiella glossodoripedis]|uniref:hypothetical protein n=1 Tax=Sneathiella glossodoripedis TaxID=418853 RepID=UPI00046EDFD8|nr:hypothetical protein [Sneathiella glossodoripedis]